MRFSHILWDWNGTLLNDVDVVVDAFNTTLREFRLSPMTADRYRSTVRHPIHEWLVEEGVIGPDQVDLFAKLGDRFHEHYLVERSRCQLHRGASELIKKLHGAKIPQAILSAHPQGMLESGVETYGLSPYFAGIFGASDTSGHGKHGIAEQLIEKLAIDRGSTILIGDMDHDAEVAQATGLACCLVGNGLQTPDRLVRCGFPVFSSLAELADHLFAVDE